MIVRVPSYTEDAILYGEYQKLFAAAAKKTGRKVTNLPEYFNALQSDATMRGIGRFARIPLDEELFKIKLNERVIEVPEHFQKHGVAVTGDHLAEFLFFRVDRYFDQTDLSTCECRIEWMTAGNKPTAAYTPAHAIDLVFEAPIDPAISPAPEYGEIIYAEDTPDGAGENGDRSAIIFGWPLDHNFTAEAGEAKFAVRFVQYDENQDGSTEITFNLVTSPVSVKILPKLPIDSEILEKVDYSATLASRPIYSGLINSTGLKPIITSYSWSDVAYVNLDAEGQALLEIEATDPDPSSYALTYQWFKDGAVIDGATKDSYTAEASGRYHVTVMNAVEDADGNKISSTSIASNPCYIPAAGEIAIDYTGYPMQLFSSGEHATANINVKFTPALEADHNLGKVAYSWAEDGIEVNTGVVESAGEYYWNVPLVIENMTHGDFVLSANHVLNKTESAVITSKAIEIRPAAQKPENIMINANEDATVFTCSCEVPGNDDIQYIWSLTQYTGTVVSLSSGWNAEKSISKEVIEAKLGRAIKEGEVLHVTARQIRFNNEENAGPTASAALDL